MFFMTITTVFVSILFTVKATIYYFSSGGSRVFVAFNLNSLLHVFSINTFECISDDPPIARTRVLTVVGKYFLVLASFRNIPKLQFFCQLSVKTFTYIKQVIYSPTFFPRQKQSISCRDLLHVQSLLTRPKEMYALIDRGIILSSIA